MVTYQQNLSLINVIYGFNRKKYLIKFNNYLYHMGFNKLQQTGEGFYCKLHKYN